MSSLKKVIGYLWLDECDGGARFCPYTNVQAAVSRSPHLEELECGHFLIPPKDLYGRVRGASFRRCYRCIDESGKVCHWCEIRAGNNKIGDNYACNACFASDPGEDICDRCLQPMKVLDRGGTLIMDTGEYVCETCWVST